MRVLNELNGAMARVWFFRDRLAEKSGTSVLADQYPNEINKLSTLDKALALINKSIGATTLPPGLTTIGAYAFRDCTSLALSALPDGVKSIGTYAFSGCTSLALSALPAGLTSISTYAFNNCASLALSALPAGITSIGAYAFRGCTSLALSALPASITSIGTYAFGGCTSLALSALPAGLTSIGMYAFSGCAGLTEITFLGTPSEAIFTSTFSSCPNLLTINVPWASGAKAGAPWGATNATINYNYTP